MISAHDFCGRGGLIGHLGIRVGEYNNGVTEGIVAPLQPLERASCRVGGASLPSLHLRSRRGLPRVPEGRSFALTHPNSSPRLKRRSRRAPPASSAFELREDWQATATPGIGCSDRLCRAAGNSILPIRDGPKTCSRRCPVPCTRKLSALMHRLQIPSRSAAYTRS